jgi:hypothetical protein
MAVPSFHWESFEFGGAAIEGVNDLHSVAFSAMKEMGLHDVENRASEVVGVSNDTIVSVCFVVISHVKWKAIVMAAGDHSKSLRDKLITRFANTTFL